MALEDKDLFEAVCKMHAGQPIEVIMAQYEKAKRINMDIEHRVAAPVVSIPEPQTNPVEPEPETAEPQQEVAPPRKKYTKRSLHVRPENAITDDVIFCCICGEERQSLTAKHLAKHGITVEDYKKLCGYPLSQPLMSGNRLLKSKEIIARAQQARLDKRMGASGE